MEVRIKEGNGYVNAEWTIEDGVMVVSPKEVKFEPKDGDVSFHDGMIYIFKGVKPSSILPGKTAIIHHCYCDGEILQVKEGVGCGYIDCSQRPATEEEKKLLFDKLAEEGYEFDFDKKEIIKLKWKPSVGQHFYFVEYDNESFAFITKAYTYAFEDQIERDKAIAKGWCFKTSKECQEFCNRLNDAINQVKP